MSHRLSKSGSKQNLSKSIDLLDAERQACLALSHVAGLGPVLLQRLLEGFGSAQAALEAPLDQWQAIAQSSVKKPTRADLQWSREHGAPWCSLTCCSAASSGHLDVLRWARENGCPWDIRVPATAARELSIEIARRASATPASPGQGSHDANSGRHRNSRGEAGQEGHGRVEGQSQRQDGSQFRDVLQYAVAQRCPGAEIFASALETHHLSFEQQRHIIEYR